MATLSDSNSNKINQYCDIITHGIYKCRLKSDSSSTSGETKMAEKCWWWGFLLIFLFFVTVFFCWSVFSNDYDDFNWFIWGQTGIWFGWGVCILSVFFVLLFYLFLLLCTGVVLIAKGESRHLHFCHKILIIVALVVCVGAYVALSKLWNEEFYSAVIALKMIAPWLHISLLFVIVISSWLMFYEIMRLESQTEWILANLGILALFLGVFFMPLYFSSPCIGPNLNSTPKPLIIAHRLGEVKHAPENTILAYEQGVKKCSSFAVESDVSISMDGVAFLMHDYHNIRRTTNVASVFPDKADEFPEYFNWTELEQLDAGSWFLKKDPFRTVKSMSSELKDKIRQQKIPKLSDIASILGPRSIIFDLYRPAEPNPYRYNFTDVALHALIDAGVPQKQILWLPGYDRDSIRDQASGLRMVSTNQPLEFLREKNISIVNLNYLEQTPESIENYVKNNVSIILYRIESPWLFSYAWCQGTAMVTTNSCERLSRISNPVWNLSKGEYIALWVCMDIFALICLLVIFFVQHRRSECAFLSRFLDNKFSRTSSLVLIVNDSESWELR